MLNGAVIGVAVILLFLVPLAIIGHWIESLRKEMKSGLEDIDSRLKAIERNQRE
jgi:hypothetical protein